MVYKSAAGMDGHPVDRKPFNWHMSMQPGDTNNTAGTSVWTDATKYPAGCIPAGAVVMEHETEANRIEVADGTDDELLLGITYYTRMAGDTRLQSYTIAGVVEMIAGATVTMGEYIMPATAAGYLGCAIPWVCDVDGTNAEGLTSFKKKFGKAITTAAAAGDRFWAYVDFTN